MFDLKQFIADCEDALQQTEPLQLVKGLVKQAIADPGGLKAAFEPTARAKSLIDSLAFNSDQLTILGATTPPGMRTPVHDHQMWVVIGVYEGEEPNEFFSVEDGLLEKKGHRIVKAGEVVALNKNAIHAISNPLTTKCRAIHVYGGDIVNQPNRSMWNPNTMVREPYDIRKLSAYIKEMGREATSESVF
ncbi:MAG: hypothetical protein COB04_09645 [Gammaproteobacteria bacterium]|nr:MAG: hypothetical protein COB04_09645 [Gammaproteobacteria bacterium]